MQDIFVFEREGMSEEGRVLGRFRPTGIRPRFAEILRARGIELDGRDFLDIDDSSKGRERQWLRRKES